MYDVVFFELRIYNGSVIGNLPEKYSLYKYYERRGVMEAALRDRLEEHGVDIAMGIKAHMGNEAMYERVLRLVLSDNSFEILFNLAESDDAEVIFDITHSLKGTLGNLGVEELSLLVTDICETTRAGSTEGVKDKIIKVQKIYNCLVECI